MQNSEYNSLTEKLIQSGIIKPDAQAEEDFGANFFSGAPSEEVQEELKEPTNKGKRLNNYDLELLENSKNEEIKEENKLQKIIYKFFPKLYEFKVAKAAIQKMDELGIDTNALLDKSIPYGEGEIRYKNLVKFIKYANEIQTKLKRK